MPPWWAHTGRPQMWTHVPPLSFLLWENRPHAACNGMQISRLHARSQNTRACRHKTPRTEEETTKVPRLRKASWELGVMLHWLVTSRLTFPEICFSDTFWRKTRITSATCCDVFSGLCPGWISVHSELMNLIFSLSLLWLHSEFGWFRRHYYNLFNPFVYIFTKQSHSECTQSFAWHTVFLFWSGWCAASWKGTLQKML